LPGVTWNFTLFWAYVSKLAFLFQVFLQEFVRISYPQCVLHAAPSHLNSFYHSNSRRYLEKNKNYEALHYAVSSMFSLLFLLNRNIFFISLSLNTLNICTQKMISLRLFLCIFVTPFLVPLQPQETRVPTVLSLALNLAITDNYTRNRKSPSYFL
jgi:hypothetical protein